MILSLRISRGLSNTSRFSEIGQYLISLTRIVEKDINSVFINRSNFINIGFKEQHYSKFSSEKYVRPIWDLRAEN